MAKRSSMRPFLLSLLLFIATASAFSPQLQLRPLSLNNGASSSSFDDYSQTEPDQELAYQDSIIGTGDVAENGSFVTVAYKGTLMSNNETFDESSRGISFNRCRKSNPRLGKRHCRHESRGKTHIENPTAIGV